MSKRAVRKPFVDRVFTTYNVHGGRPLSAIRSSVRVVVAEENSDVVVLCEMQDTDVDEVLNPKHWINFQSSHLGAKARCSVSFRRDVFAPHGRGLVRLLHRSRLYKSALRFFVLRSVRDRESGRLWTVIGVHFGPHADDSQGGITNMPRGRLVLLGIRVLVACVRWLRGSVALGGDVNINGNKDLRHHDRTDLIEQMSFAGLRSPLVELGPAHPTHGHDMFDQWFFKIVAGKMMRQHVGLKRGSDHHSYSVTIRQHVAKWWTKRRGK